MDDVSRETPTAPPEAVALFPGERLALAELYAGLLATDGVVGGLLGPREAPRLWERHLLNSAVLGELVDPGSSVADVGSGAGLPGLVLAIARPDLRVTLIEPLLRRTRFLDEAVDALGLGDQVEVLRGRAEEVSRGRTFGVVTARAVAPLDRLVGWCLPLVAPTGVLLAMKGSSAADEVAHAQGALRRLGCAPPQVLEIGRHLAGGSTRVVRVARALQGQVG
jgi:16S rRNA (guanine527-N7)-methyltransferase